MVTFVCLVIFLYVFISAVVYKGYKIESIKKNNTNIWNSENSAPFLSLVISAKNEEDNINSLFDSLERLNYPENKFEVIIINDGSADNTEQIIKKRIFNNANYSLIKSDKKEFAGKKGALAIGIKKAKYDFIAITDADCKPEKQWLNVIAEKLDAGYDFVFGVAPLYSGDKVIEKISAFETLRNFYLNITAVGLNIPFSAAARSFAFRRKSFEKIGGYSNTTETISGDDDLLLREAVKNKMLIGTFMQKDSFVFSSPPDSLQSYLKQRKRHLQTSFYYLPAQKLFLGIWFTINIISFFSVFGVFVSPVAAIPFCVKMVSDVFVSMKHQKELGHSFKFYQLVYLQIFYEFFVVVNFFNSLSEKTEWK
jgi:cellulose synthase/poly-beta-1,6-N-acetylglucosamine synthase-like glycosyltransferase